MDNVARFTAAQRRELFSEAGARLGMTPAVVEKDFWVSWVLGRLFSTPNLARLLMFKGGTSLSKVYGLIERFSEDIDLILDWRVLGDDDPLAVRSKARQTNLNKSISQQAKDYIGTTLLSELTVALDGICHCRVGEDDAHVIQVRYPAAFSDTYLRPELQLEIGPLAAWLPYENRQISAYASAVFPNLFARREVAVRVISAERTFWEKVTILHQEAHRPEGSPQPARYSRHYYDLARMAASPVKTLALADGDLLANVVIFKQRFYPRAWARYELAVPGSLRLLPGEAVLARLEADYRAMGNMIFGQIPEFADIITQLGVLEKEINGCQFGGCLKKYT